MHIGNCQSAIYKDSLVFATNLYFNNVRYINNTHVFQYIFSSHIVPIAYSQKVFTYISKEDPRPTIRILV